MSKQEYYIKEARLHIGESNLKYLVETAQSHRKGVEDDLLAMMGAAIERGVEAGIDRVVGRVRDLLEDKT